MGVSIEFVDSDESFGPFDVGSASSWAELVRWIEGLKGSPKLKELARTGAARGTDELALELDAALEAEPPVGAALAVAEHLQELTGSGAPDETVSTTDA